jgi:sorbose reductase
MPIGGADVAITYTSSDPSSKAKEIAEKFKVNVRAFKCDVTKSKEVENVVKEVMDSFGKEIDIGVNNAGESFRSRRTG